MRRLAAVTITLVLFGCQDTAERSPNMSSNGDGGTGFDGSATSSTIPRAKNKAENPVRPKLPPPKAGAMITIEAGKVLAGSRPGTAGRTAEAEMDDEPVAIGSFMIDALPFPNDPVKAPMTEVSFERASELCQAKGKRLCDELEWELACEGPDGLVYPYGNEYDSGRYGAVYTVASPAEVRAMGGIVEWTSSYFGGETKGAKTVRGARSGEGTASTRRCARRTEAEPSASETWLGFRCCKGPPQDLTYTMPSYVQPFTRLELTLEEYQAMIRSVPELERLHKDPTMFTREDLYKMRQEGGLSGSITAIGALTYKAIRWVPTNGEEIIVATGREGMNSFIVALYPLGGERFVHAASYVLVHEDAPVLLAYTRNPRHIRWLPCWDCTDGGLLTINDEGLVDISQRW